MAKNLSLSGASPGQCKEVTGGRDGSGRRRSWVFSGGHVWRSRQTKNNRPGAELCWKSSWDPYPHRVGNGQSRQRGVGMSEERSENTQWWQEIASQLCWERSWQRVDKEEVRWTDRRLRQEAFKTFKKLELVTGPKPLKAIILDHVCCLIVNGHSSVLCLATSLALLNANLIMFQNFSWLPDS